MAQDGPGAARTQVNFNIPAEPLAGALDLYSTASGVQVLYDSSLAAGRLSTAVSGIATPAEGLKTLLKGTGLAVEYAGSNQTSFVLFDPDRPNGSLVDAPVLALDTLNVEGGPEIGAEGNNLDRFEIYNEILQADVRQALMKNARMRANRYNLAINLWVSPAGIIEHTEFVMPTKNRDRDVTIARALQGLAIRKPPPKNMPQPISIRIAYFGS